MIKENRCVAGFSGIMLVWSLGIAPLHGEAAFPAEAVRAGGEVVVDLPDLGGSASSRGKEPVRARVVFPDDWQRERNHPVFVQFHGSYGANEIMEPWPEIFGGGNWIFLAVDYPMANPYPAGMANARQALEMLREVADLDEDRLVAGGNASGAYSICHGLHSGGGEEFDAFIFVMGGTEQGRTATRLGERPVLVIEAEKDTEKRRETTARLLAKLNGRENLTHVVVEGMEHAWPPPGKLRGEVVTVARDWLSGIGMTTGELTESLPAAEPAALAAKAVADEKAYRFAAALAGYRTLKSADPAMAAGAEAGIARILARRDVLLEKAAGMRASDPQEADVLLAKIAEVFGEVDGE